MILSRGPGIIPRHARQPGPAIVRIDESGGHRYRYLGQFLRIEQAFSAIFYGVAFATRFHVTDFGVRAREEQIRGRTHGSETGVLVGQGGNKWFVR